MSGITELQIHIKSVWTLRQQLAPGWIICHPPNETAENDRRRRSKLMAMGMLPGAPDLFIFSPSGAPHCLEFKSETGRLSESQCDFQTWAIKANVPYAVARSVEQAMRIFTHWGCMVK